MSDNILDQIDSALAEVTSCFCGCMQEIKAKSPSPWFASEDCQARWNARQNASKSSTGERPPRGGLAACRGCWQVALVLPDAKLCGPCSALPSCGAERSNERTGRRMVCFRPAGHAPATHEDFDTGSQWVEPFGTWEEFAAPESQVEALRPETTVRGRLEPDGPIHPGPGQFRPLGEVQFIATAPEVYWPEPGAPLVDASSDTAPDEARSRFRFTDLYAALRARARRGGTPS